MFQLLKRLTAALCVGCLLLTGCNASEEEQTVTEEKIEISENSVYLAPEDPTAYMKTAYDEVSDALSASDEEEEAEALAKLFVADFFTLSNKTSDTDIGGLNYIPSDAYEDMEVYARFYFYNNYSSIVAEYGEEQLPTVEDVTVSDVQATQITYGETQAQDLKTSAVLSIAKMEDYDHDTLTAINNGELEEVPLPKTLMRVIALA